MCLQRRSHFWQTSTKSPRRTWTQPRVRLLSAESNATTLETIFVTGGAGVSRAGIAWHNKRNSSIGWKQKQPGLLRACCSCVFLKSSLPCVTQEMGAVGGAPWYRATTTLAKPQQTSPPATE